MYSIRDFGVMIEDSVRMQAYEQALAKTIKPGAVVVDLGTGTGIFSLLACKFGAAQVYAIDPNPAIQLARDIARANGFAGKITFVQDLSTEATLPEKADLIVSDMRGTLPLYGTHIPAIIDARQRFLKPGGHQIPRQDSLMIAGVDAADLYRQVTRPWSENLYTLDMRAGLRYVTNTWGKGRATEEQLVLSPRRMALLDYTSIEESNISCQLQWQVRNPGSLHGYQVWFDTVLTDGVYFSAGPYTPELIYGTQFFPLSETVELQPGDIVEVKFEAKLMEDDYVWRWDTSVQREGETIADSRQNSLAAVPLSLDKLKKRSDAYEPTLNEDGEAARFTLEMMNRHTPLGGIASALLKRYPERFSNWDRALSFVGKLSEKYT